jgi:type IV fimbrial biogenesis protein FimT
VLILRHLQRGVSLVELLVGLTIVAILLGTGVPSFFNWIQNTQIRTAAESIQSGLQLARSEAVRRNASIRFQLTDTMTSACIVSAAGTNWVISQDDLAGTPGACATAESESGTLRIIQKHAGTEGSTNIAVNATEDLVTPATPGLPFNRPIIFNGLGKIPAPSITAGYNVSIGISNPSGGSCIDAGGKMRCLRVVVSTGGRIRMCDPSLASSDPRAC